MKSQRFPYITFSCAAKRAGVSRQRFIRAFRQLRLESFPIEGSDMVVIHERDVKPARAAALAQRPGRPKKKGSRP